MRFLTKDMLCLQNYGHIFLEITETHSVLIYWTFWAELPGTKLPVFVWNGKDE